MMKTCKYLLIGLLVLAGTLRASEQQRFTDLDCYSDEEKALYLRLAYKIYDPATRTEIDSLMQAAKAEKSVRLQLMAYQLSLYNNVNLGKIEEALQEGREAIRLSKDFPYEQVHYDFYLRHISVLIQVNRSVEALQVAIEMSREASESNVPYGMASANYCLGAVFTDRGNYQVAMPYLKKAIQLIEEYNLNFYTYAAYAQLVECAAGMDDRAAFEEYLKQSENHATNDVERFNAQCATIYQGYGIIPDGKYLELSEQLLKNPLYDNVVVESVRQELALYRLLAQGKAMQAYAMVDSLKDFKKNSEIKIKILSKLGRYSEALDLQKKWDLYRDSVNSNFQAEDLAAAYAGMENVELKNKAERLSVRNRLYLLTFGLASTLLIICFLLFINFNRRKHLLQVTKMNEELAKARDLAEQASEMKTRFIQNMTHEFRTPLNSIVGCSQMLLDPTMELDAETKRVMRSEIDGHTKQLTQLINNVILLSNYDSGGVELNQGDWDCNLLMDMAFSATPMAQDTKLHMERINRLPEGTTLHTDGAKLQQALTCLIDNALKFTSEGEVRLICEPAAEEGKVCIVVEDTGRGVPVGKEEEIFERFKKLDEFIPGTGLGLSMCRLIVERLGGKVSLDPAYTQGARFVITL